MCEEVRGAQVVSSMLILLYDDNSRFLHLEKCVDAPAFIRRMNVGHMGSVGGIPLSCGYFKYS